MIGFITGFITYAILLGYSLVETILLTTAFNYLAPIVQESYFEGIPFVHIDFWPTFAFLIIIHIVGYIIERLVPTIVNIESNRNS